MINNHLFVPTFFDKTKTGILVIVGNNILFNITAWLLLRETTVLTYVAALFQQIAQDDSWMMIRKAIHYIHSGVFQESSSDQSIYSTLFFGQNIKFQYPLTSIVLFEPFVQSPDFFLASNETLNMISFVMIGIICALMCWLYLSLIKVKNGDKTLSIPGTMFHSILPILFTLTFYPLLRSYVLGQIQTWIDCFFIAAVVAWLYKKKAAAGFLCGLIAIIKPQYGLFLLWGLVKKEWNFTICFAATAMFFVILSIDLYGIANVLDYFSVISHLTRYGESYYPNQSMNGVLNRMLFNGNNLVWEEFKFAPFHPLVFAGTHISSILLILFALLWNRKKKKNELIDFLVAALSFTMAAPIAWEHHYGIMLPMFIVCFFFIISSSSMATSLSVLLLTSFILSSNYFQFTEKLAETPFNFLQSYLFIGAILLLIVLYRLRDNLAGANLAMKPA